MVCFVEIKPHQVMIRCTFSLPQGSTLCFSKEASLAAHDLAYANQQLTNELFVQQAVCVSYFSGAAYKNDVMRLTLGADFAVPGNDLRFCCLAVIIIFIACATGAVDEHGVHIDTEMLTVTSVDVTYDCMLTVDLSLSVV